MAEPYRRIKLNNGNQTLPNQTVHHSRQLGDTFDLRQSMISKLPVNTVSLTKDDA